MIYDAILFDLDGTLLPMDNDEFTMGYFQILAKTAAKCGYEKDVFIPAMWKGVSSMVKNDGSCNNEEVFWKTASAILGEKIYEYIPVFEEFYGNEFHEAKKFTGPNLYAKEAIALAREKGKKVILATNPLFPTVAVHSRLGWIGLKPEDFDWITDYTNSCTCKPNPAYYKEISEKFSLDPKKCLMIGNNAQEDAEAAGSVGMKTFLVTDWLISNGTTPECPKGSFKDLVEYLKNMEGEEQMENGYSEYITFEVTAKDGSLIEMAVMDEFDFEGDHYVVGAVIEGDTINDDGRYIYRSIVNGDDFTVEKIKKEFDYRRIAEAYMKIEDSCEEGESEE